MSLLKNISDFFQSIFMASSPEVKQRQALGYRKQWVSVAGWKEGLWEPRDTI